LAVSYGRIAKIAAQLSYGLVKSAMGQIPCSTERISSLHMKSHPNVDTIAFHTWGFSNNHSAAALLAMRSAVIARAIPSVCPSVCLSHAGIVPKRMKIRSCGLHDEVTKTL